QGGHRRRRIMLLAQLPTGSMFWVVTGGSGTCCWVMSRRIMCGRTLTLINRPFDTPLSWRYSAKDISQARAASTEWKN
ncbi:TPA: hypothetical protein ACNV5A_004738, partial [Aeromonas hydrophila]